METDRLLLRDLVDSDFEIFYEHLSSDYHWPNIPMDEPTRTSIRDYFDFFVDAQEIEPRRDYFLLAADKQSGEIIGEGCLRILSFGSRNGALGWGVAVQHAGRGMGTEIGRALLQLSFDRLDLHRVEAQCRTSNAASRRVMAKIGMREEGIFRDNMLVRGEWWSTAQYALLATDEQAPRGLHRQAAD